MIRYNTPWRIDEEVHKVICGDASVGGSGKGGEVEIGMI